MTNFLVLLGVLLLGTMTVGAEDGQKSTNFALRLAMFDQENGTTPWKFPHKIYIGRHVYLEIQIKWIKIENQVDQLNNFLITPQDCFFSTNSNPTALEETHHIIESGCATSGAQVSFFPSATASKRRFSIFVASNYFPSRAFMFLHCKAVLCSLKNTDGLFPHQRGDNKTDVAGELCPIDACQTPTFVPGDHTRAFSIFSGPLQASLAPELFGAADDAPPPSWTIDGQKMPQNMLQKEAPLCDSCPDDHDDPDQLSVASSGQKLTSVSSQNCADTMTLFGVAALSFVIGMFLMAGLLYVHKVTEPNKLARAKQLQKSLSGAGNNYQQRPIRAPSSSDEQSQPSGCNQNLAECTASTRLSADVSTGTYQSGGKIRGDDSVLLLALGDERCC